MKVTKTEQACIEEGSAGSLKDPAEYPEGDGKKDFISNIIDNYRSMEESIVAQLNLYYQHHGAETGMLREDIWLQLFEQIIPKKFYIEHSIFIIDSYKHISKEIDLAIVDRSYTPYIFQYGRLKFIPIEAVAAVVECKSKTPGNGMQEWLNSVKALKTSTESVVRMVGGIACEGSNHFVVYRQNEQSEPPEEDNITKASETGDKDKQKEAPKVPTQTSTRPIRIFCGYQSHVDPAKTDFDFYLIAGGKENEKGIRLIVSGEYSSLEDWYRTLNHAQGEGEKIECPVLRDERYAIDKYRIQDGGKEVPLMSFNFLLNQLLMLINNPILFPHIAYANMFNRIERSKGEENG